MKKPSKLIKEKIILGLVIAVLVIVNGCIMQNNNEKVQEKAQQENIRDIPGSLIIKHF